MNVLFLTLGKMGDLAQHGIYTDLLRQFIKNQHNVYVVSMHERREKMNTTLKELDGAHILQVKTGNIRECGIIEKGISTLMIGSQYRRAISRYFNNIKFDLIMYSTPPISFVSVVNSIKKKNAEISYLILKDIFPQNAVDVGMLSTQGLKGFIYRYFRSQEKKLYRVSDYIGCMSKANVDYVIEHNPSINPKMVEVCPNSIDPENKSITENERQEMRKKYILPQDKKILVYGGNLGRPQGIPFLMDCLQAEKENENIFFLIIGSGTEFAKLDAYINNNALKNARLMKYLPKEDYDRLVAACDVGMIFLDHRFTIPNFPSRILSYMQAKLPVLACTDPNTDIGKVITDGCFGWWCESNDVQSFSNIVEEITSGSDLQSMGQNSYQYLVENYDVSIAYNRIMSHLRG